MYLGDVKHEQCATLLFHRVAQSFTEKGDAMSQSGPCKWLPSKPSVQKQADTSIPWFMCHAPSRDHTLPTHRPTNRPSNEPTIDRPTDQPVIQPAKQPRLPDCPISPQGGSPRSPRSPERWAPPHHYTSTAPLATGADLTHGFLCFGLPDKVMRGMAKMYLLRSPHKVDNLGNRVRCTGKAFRRRLAHVGRLGQVSGIVGLAGPPGICLWQGAQRGRWWSVSLHVGPV